MLTVLYTSFIKIKYFLGFVRVLLQHKKRYFNFANFNPDESAFQLYKKWKTENHDLLGFSLDWTGSFTLKMVDRNGNVPCSICRVRGILLFAAGYNAK